MSCSTIAVNAAGKAAVTTAFLPFLYENLRSIRRSHWRSFSWICLFLSSLMYALFVAAGLWYYLDSVSWSATKTATIIQAVSVCSSPVFFTAALQNIFSLISSSFPSYFTTLCWISAIIGYLVQALHFCYRIAAALGALPSPFPLSGLDIYSIQSFGHLIPDVFISSCFISSLLRVQSGGNRTTVGTATKGQRSKVRLHTAIGLMITVISGTVLLTIFSVVLRDPFQITVLSLAYNFMEVIKLGMFHTVISIMKETFETKKGSATAAAKVYCFCHPLTPLLKTTANGDKPV